VPGMKVVLKMRELSKTLVTLSPSEMARVATLLACFRELPVRKPAEALTIVTEVSRGFLQDLYAVVRTITVFHILFILSVIVPFYARGL
jgi:hypothetical protein